jgi:fructosamine-3-kinase
LGKEVTLKESSGAGLSGGGGAFTSTAIDQEGTKYFIKSATGKIDMLRAEYLGVKEMADTHTIRVPTPIAFGEHRSRAFAVFEYLDFCRGGSEYELGKQLAKMHRATSDGLGFGFHVDNTIGATPQPNLPWIEKWQDFWEEKRLNHMLKLCNNLGIDEKTVDALRTKTRELLSHNPAPSLVHGDLWGGNKGYCKDKGKVVPVIFDPATY